MATQGKVTILCVDDEKDIVDALYDTLTDIYNVKTATRGADALKIINEEEVVVIISDQRMPEMTGSELLAQINKVKPHIKKILLTGYADVNAAVDAINNGAVNKYINKPWDDEELTNTVAHLVAMYNTEMKMKKMLADTKSQVDKISSWKQQLEAIANFVESCKTGMCVVDKNGKIVYMNGKGLDTLKQKEMSAVKGQEFTNFFPLTEVERTTFRDLYEKGGFQSILNAKQADGSSTMLQASIVFINDEGKMRVSGITFNRPQ